MGSCFTIVGGALHQGIRLTNGVIRVGESGRGRKETLVPTPNPVDGERLVAIPGPATVVLIKDHSGFRGSWQLVEYATHRCTLEGRLPEQEPGAPVTAARTCPDCGEVFLACSHQCHHPAAPARPVNPHELGIVLGEGFCAQGDAGRMGGGPEYLIALTPGIRFSIRRGGRLYGAVARINVELTDGVPLLTDAWAMIKAAEAAAAWAHVLETP